MIRDEIDDVLAILTVMFNVQVQQIRQQYEFVFIAGGSLNLIAVFFSEQTIGTTTVHDHKKHGVL